MGMGEGRGLHRGTLQHAVNSSSSILSCRVFYFVLFWIHAFNVAVQQGRLAAIKTHNSLQHSTEKRAKKTILSGVLVGLPFAELLNAATHLCCVPDTPVT